MKAQVTTLDVTNCCNFENSQYIHKVLDVYVFNPEEHTYLCEGTPSYFLVYLYTVIMVKKDTPEEIANNLHEQEAECTGEDTYTHAGKVTVVAEGVFDDLESAAEYYRGNCPI